MAMHVGAKRGAREAFPEGITQGKRHRRDDDGWDPELPDVRCGVKLGGRYVVEELLGIGTFGTVFRCSRGRRLVAVKVIKEKRLGRRVAHLEQGNLEFMQGFRSDLLVQLAGTFHHQGLPCFVFPLYGPNLLTLQRVNDYRAFPLLALRRLAFFMLSAVHDMHSIGVIHTDLKPENVLLESGDVLRLEDLAATIRVRICDFGNSTQSQYGQWTASTPNYRAPEVVLGQRWDAAIDVWSVGCILFEMWNGATLFRCTDLEPHRRLIHMEHVLGQRVPESVLARGGGEGVIAQYWEVRRKEAGPDEEEKEMAASLARVPPELKALLTSLLVFEPSARATPKEALKNPFLMI